MQTALLVYHWMVSHLAEIGVGVLGAIRIAEYYFPNSSFLKKADQDLSALGAKGPDGK